MSEPEFSVRPSVGATETWVVPFEWAGLPAGTRVTIQKAREIVLTLRAHVAEADAAKLAEELREEQERRRTADRSTETMIEQQRVARASGDRALTEARSLSKTLHDKVVVLAEERDALKRELASAKLRARQARAKR